MKFRMLILVGLLLFAFGTSQAADSLTMAIYGVTEGRLLDPANDTLKVDDYDIYDYQLWISCANDSIVIGIQHGFVFTDYSGTIAWRTQPDGWGPQQQNSGWAATTVPVGCRIDPPATMFGMTGGLIVTEQDMDGVAPDTIFFGGLSLFDRVPVGPDEVWIKLHFALSDLALGATSTISIDSAWVPPGGVFSWIMESTQVFIPNVSPKLTFNVKGVGALDADDNGMDHFVYGLDQNFPNPFNPTTRINYTMERKGHVNLSVYNILGQRVITLIDEELEAGPGVVEWNAVDENGSGVASGIYFYKIATSNFVETRKMVLMR